MFWADEQHAITGRWPKTTDLHVVGDLNEKWKNINQSLLAGGRGLPGGDSLAKLLARERGVRNTGDLPSLTVAQILAWADAQRARTGRWPNTEGDSGPVLAAPGEVWATIDQHLRDGGRGLPGGDSLAKLLARERGVRNGRDLPPFTQEQLLTWVREYHQATGAWPTALSGPVAGAPGETWGAVQHALFDGLRGLPGGDSLARFVARHFQVRNVTVLPRLTRREILQWADAYHARTGDWPRVDSGEIPESPGETWRRVDDALRLGMRGLRRGVSLKRLLANHRGVHRILLAPRLTIDQILQWADAHRERTGRWPVQASGPILDAPGETWNAIWAALYLGLRGLRGGTSLAQLLRRRRGVKRGRDGTRRPGPNGG